MKLLLLSLTISISITQNVLAQTNTLFATVYFDNDKYDLRPDGRATIEKILDSLAEYKIDKIVLNGHTDSSADSLYNITLSSNRNTTVENYLITKGIDEEIISSAFFGEEKPATSNENDDGKQRNRRVDITFYYEKNIEPVVQIEIVETNPCIGKDTVITLAGGTQLVFNLCEYLDLKDCIEITEIYNPQDALANDLTLMDARGSALASCGMFGISLNPGCTNQSCFKFPVKVRFPIRPSDPCQPCGRNANLYMANSAGQWELGEGKKSEFNIIQNNGVAFFEYEILCPGGMQNCDCKLKGKKVKFKTKRNYNIVGVQILSDCPLTIINFKPKKRTHVAKTKKIVPCFQQPTTVIATVIDANGDTLYLPETPLSKFKKRKFRPRCKKTTYPLYRKYFITPEQLLKKED